MISGMYIIVFWGRYYNIGAGSKEPALRVFIEEKNSMIAYHIKMWYSGQELFGTKAGMSLVLF